MREELALVVQHTVKIGAVDALDEGVEPEVRDDPLRVRFGFRRADEQSGARGKRFECCADAGIGDVLLPAELAVALAIGVDRALDDRTVGALDQLSERLAQRRADATTQDIIAWIGCTKSRQRVPDAAGDAGEVIGKRAVEVEQQDVTATLMAYRAATAPCSRAASPSRLPPTSGSTPVRAAP